MISTHWGLCRITIDQAVLSIEEQKSIPETRGVGIGQEQLPAATPIGRLIEARRVAGATRQNQNMERVPGPNATKIQLGCSGRHGAALPKVASVLAAQDRATSAARPSHAS